MSSSMPTSLAPIQTIKDDQVPASTRQSIRSASINQQDKIALEDARLRSLWDDSMKQVGGPWQPHRKAVVLMLSWAPELDELQTSEEVEKLGNVFVDEFNYKVIPGRIEKSDKLPQHQVSKHLADFVYHHDGEGSLLIIYYAGHGIQGAPGELTLAGNNKPNDTISERNAILWHEAECIVKQTRADVLIIFDCCFAGNLIPPGRSIHPVRNFEFLAATGRSTITPVPGPNSFTTALVWALKKLVAIKVPFSTTELLNQIGNEAPDFPKKQYPILKERYESSDRRLMLAPISTGGELGPRSLLEKRKENPKTSIYLRFLYEKLPSDNEIERLARAMKNLMESGDISASRIGWGGLQSRDIVRAAAMKWRSYRKSPTPSQVANGIDLSPQETEISDPVGRQSTMYEVASLSPYIDSDLQSAYFHMNALIRCLTVALLKTSRASA